ncbi:MAG: hypothetical protein PWR01_3528 [Clostridiales bacterium]|nr:hypothetical protein [Clostridiales bacterium]MDN5282455.1 hypothetical protein [Candidatus Ozemobacter sp.]
MINQCFSRKKGMLMVLVVGALVFSMIIFISLVNRVRQESSLTNRVSNSEKLYQLASAIGRISVRKLQRDFETRDPDFCQKIIKAAFNGETGKMSEENYTSVIEGLDVTKAVRKMLEDDGGEIDFEVTFVVDLGDKFPFRAPMVGMQNSPFERKGNIEVTVSATHKSMTKVSRMRKEFLLTRLLAPPFYRFTLFSHKGASIDKNLANRTLINDSGKLQRNRPLVCLNRRVPKRQNAGEGFDFRFNRADNIVKTIDGQPSFVKSGWIYLGGRGNTTDTSGDTGNLVLNVNTGSSDDAMQNCFGEYFHFYFNPNSAGWTISKDWTKWLDARIPGNNVSEEVSKIMVAMVDYGYYSGLWQIKFRDKPLFGTAVNIYNSTVNEDIDRGNSMHLFGTPAICTPTLVFGKIKRRYVRTYAFYFSEKLRVYPLRAFTQNLSYSDFICNEVPDFYREIMGSSASEELIRDFYSVMTTELDVTKYQVGLPSNSPPLGGLDPKIVDYEPYLTGLKNICDPGAPDRSWKDVVPKNGYVDDGPEDLCKSDYDFKNDKEIYYSGNIRQIAPGANYLKDRMSYLIEGEGGKPVFLSKCEFFQKKFMVEDRGKRKLYLNCIIGFKGDLVIDMPLEVAKGGVILCDGKVEVQKPIINPYLAGGAGSHTNPDAFGYLTIVARKGINLGAGKAFAGPLPEVHGFFISINDGAGRVTVSDSFHIIGGVASDNIDDFVKNGCIIEWGFYPEELAGDNDMALQDFYGLSMGPRDIEIISEE